MHITNHLCFVLLFVIPFLSVRAQNSTSPPSQSQTCTGDQFQGLLLLGKIIQTFPQNNATLPLSVQIITAIPSNLVGLPTGSAEAFGGLAAFFGQLYEINEAVNNGAPSTLDTYAPACVTLNALNASAFHSFVTIENLEAIFILVHDGVTNYLSAQPMASNFTVEYYSSNAPGAVRLALVPNGMVVSWQTQNAYSLNDPPVVWYGLNANNLNINSTGTSHTYGTVYFHDVVLSTLLPNTLYYFTIANDINQTIYNFTTAPLPGTNNNNNNTNNNTPSVITVLGDMGYINALETYNSLLAEIHNTDLILHIGDISYADDAFLRPEYTLVDTYEETWDVWQQWMSPITSQVPYMVLPGNHEAACQLVFTYLACPINQQNFTAYRHRFRMPSVESGAGEGVENMWSSFDYGLVHFVMIDTETDFPGSPEGVNGVTVRSGPFGGNAYGNPTQLQWLQADLQKANNNRAQVPWVVVMGHRPIYTGILASDGNSAIEDFNSAVAIAFESIIANNSVDVYLAGHMHFYERLYPLSGGVPQHFSGNVYSNPTYPTYIINGAAGNDEGHEAEVYNQTIGAYFNNQNYGYGKLLVYNATHLQWQFIRATDSGVDDYVWITQTSRNNNNTTVVSTTSSAPGGGPTITTGGGSSDGMVLLPSVIVFVLLLLSSVIV